MMLDETCSRSGQFITLVAVSENSYYGEISCAAGNMGSICFDPMSMNMTQSVMTGSEMDISQGMHPTMNDEQTFFACGSIPGNDQAKWCSYDLPDYNMGDIPSFMSNDTVTSYWTNDANRGDGWSRMGNSTMVMLEGAANVMCAGAAVAILTFAF